MVRYVQKKGIIEGGGLFLNGSRWVESIVKASLEERQECLLGIASVEQAGGKFTEVFATIRSVGGQGVDTPDLRSGL
jgi:hypothetical protein